MWSRCASGENTFVTTVISQANHHSSPLQSTNTSWQVVQLMAVRALLRTIAGLCLSGMFLLLRL